jgi:hypothetical protein
MSSRSGAKHCVALRREAERSIVGVGRCAALRGAAERCGAEVVPCKLEHRRSYQLS